MFYFELMSQWCTCCTKLFERSRLSDTWQYNKGYSKQPSRISFKRYRTSTIQLPAFNRTSRSSPCVTSIDSRINILYQKGSMTWSFQYYILVAYMLSWLNLALILIFDVSPVRDIYFEVWPVREVTKVENHWSTSWLDRKFYAKFPSYRNTTHSPWLGWIYSSLAGFEGKAGGNRTRDPCLRY